MTDRRIADFDVEQRGTSGRIVPLAGPKRFDAADCRFKQ
jgi:hypothetical protein